MRLASLTTAAARIITTTALLAACGAEPTAATLAGGATVTAALSADDRTAGEALLFVYEGQSDTKDQPSWTGAASCAGTRTKLFAQRETFKAVSTYAALAKTAEFTRLEENLSAYHRVGCDPGAHTAECDALREKLFADLEKVLATQEYDVMAKQEEYQSLVAGYHDAVANQCIEHKRI